MGGEKSISQQKNRRLRGSPPHGRGKERPPISTAFMEGITPAWAGKSTSITFKMVEPEDHPRMGGEKFLFSPTKRKEWGSPPHGRGKADNTNTALTAERITPAWAGKSFRSAQQERKNGDHPRMGGEKTCTGLGGVVWGGSPPHGRGKAVFSRCFQQTARITPAWAGKSLRKLTLLFSRRDHPRMGGEKTKKIP